MKFKDIQRGWYHLEHTVSGEEFVAWTCGVENYPVTMDLRQFDSRGWVCTKYTVSDVDAEVPNLVFRLATASELLHFLWNGWENTIPNGNAKYAMADYTNIVSPLQRIVAPITIPMSNSVQTLVQSVTQQFNNSIAGIKNTWAYPIDDIKVSITIETQCECGATKCGSNIHSNWCPKHKT